MAVARTKKAPCPICSPEHPIRHRREYGWREDSESFGPVWQCPLCEHETPIRETRKRLDQPTPSQEQARDNFLEGALRRERGGDLIPEIQGLETELDAQGTLRVLFHVGFSNLPSNAVGNIYRSWYQVWITRGGAIHSYNREGKKVPGPQAYLHVNF